MKLILILITALLFSCAENDNLLITEDGCALRKSIDSNGNPYYIGACANKSIVMQWTQADKTVIRAVYAKDDTVRFYLKQADGTWREVSSKEPYVNNIPSVAAMRPTEM